MKINKKAQKALRVSGTYEAQLVVHWIVVNVDLRERMTKGGVHILIFVYWHKLIFSHVTFKIRKNS